MYKLPASLEAPLTRFDSGLTLADVLPSDEAPDAADRDTAGSQLRADLDNVLCTLSAREAGVLRARYGLDDGCPRTLEDIGQAFQVRSGPGAGAEVFLPSVGAGTACSRVPRGGTASLHNFWAAQDPARVRFSSAHGGGAHPGPSAMCLACMKLRWRVSAAHSLEDRKEASSMSLCLPVFTPVGWCVAGHARAHPPDRGQGHPEAAPPQPQRRAARVHGRRH